jgi:sulfopyruvate decarboxylase subunit beta
VTPGDVLDAVIRHRGEAAVVTGPGAISGALWSRAHEPATIYNMDMAYATAVSLGVAMAAPRTRVLAIEGDGSMVAGLAVFSTIARYKPQNLAVLVVDNGSFASTGGQGWFSTGTSSGTDIAAIAEASGIDREHVLGGTTLETLDGDVARILDEPGPWVLVVRVEVDEMTLSPKRPRTGIDWADAATSFRQELQRRMGTN